VLTDNSNHTTNCSFDITVIDNELPVAICQNVAIYLDAAGQASVTAAQFDNGSHDNCGIASLSLSKYNFDCSNLGANTVTMTVLDIHGNSSTCSCVVTVYDNIAPTVITKDINVYLDGAGQASIVAADVNNGTYDNCSFTLTVVPNTFNCSNLGPNTVTLTATDPSSNVSSNTAIVTVIDNIPPTFTAPIDITIYTDPYCSYDATVSATGDVTDEADNCTTNFNATFSDVIVAGSCQGTMVITRTWSLVDGSNNAALDQVQVITVLDNIVPTFSAPADITIYSDANCNYDASVLFTGDVTDEADNCSTGLNATYSDATAAGSCQGAVVITRTWSLIDNCGNSAANQVQIITVSDNIPPTFTVPADITIYSDASCNYDASVSFTGDVTDEADNCSTGLNATFSDVTIAGSCQGTKVITRTWDLTDNCNNSTNHIQIITVLDNIAPTFSAPADLTIYSDGNCNYDASVSFTGDVTDEADNCSSGINATFTDVSASGSCQGAIVITRTWSLVDNCGNNAANQVQIITVLDNIAPTFSIPADISIYSDSDCNYDVSVSITGDVTDETDNCSTGLDATFNDVTTAGSCQGEMVITRTWSLVDDCGNNAANQIQTITVLDNIAPTFSIPADITIYTDASCSYNASVSSTGDVTDENDNCSTTLNATYSDVVHNGNCQGAKVITRTWSLVDNCNNNAADQTQTITVLDNIAPIAISKNITIQLDANGNASFTAAQVNNGSTDNCTASNLLQLSVTPNTFSCSEVGPNTVTLTVTDDCNNSSSITAIVNVEDNIAPVIGNCPNDTIVYANKIYCEARFVNLVEPSAYDNCSYTLTSNIKYCWICNWIRY